MAIQADPEWGKWSDERCVIATPFICKTRGESFSLVLRHCPRLCVFAVIRNASIDSRSHCRLCAFFRLLTLKLSKTVELQVVMHVELYTHATITRACDIFSHRFHFDAFSTDNTISMRFHFDHSLSRAFSNRCVFDENAQNIRTDGRPECIKMYAILKRNVFVWTRL